MIFRTIILLFVCTAGLAQDTTKSSWYGRALPYCLYTGPGFQKDRVSQNIEFGRSFGVIDAGLAFGRMSQRPDSTFYLEGRITMDACQIGIFSSEFTLGGGKVFNQSTPVMLELSYTIFAQLGKNFGVGVISGNYDFSGNYAGINKNFYGVFLRYGLARNNGLLITRKVPGRIHTQRAHHI
jgi:hypothetical protein